MTELTHQEVVTLLKELFYAALFMPRHTPYPGDAGTMHNITIPASHIWGMDTVMKEVANRLNLPDSPANCCVGSASFDEGKFVEFVAGYRNLLSE